MKLNVRVIATGILLIAGALGISGCRTASLDPVELGLTRIAGERPDHYPVHGIDISKYQGDVDWRAARADGVEFVYIKATEGGDRLDERFHENWRGARDAGIPHGAYHFFYWCRPGIEQARWFIKNVPQDALSLPPVLDVEWTPHSPTCTRRPDRAEMQREMTAFMDALERHYGMRPIIYAPIDIHRDRLVGTYPNHRFWLRAVADHPDNVYEARDFHFWQYTATGTVAGIEGDVDRNAFSGSRQDWQRWLSSHTRR
ncbi:glycoside hydrolase family 25 protein [Aureimonas altamirensis]|uniref:glycoside hydrolase family 25 protein n=1 Tax=Aureimonas altamirensis TaxID=370622 RepID=UPI0020373918|nr:glycoside hydrolase family 25 protein [Aureimonas altamirensis]MCM2503726.1 glycoside hydrolase family 25 protein [Aureimonas altamirensis]